MKHTIEMNIKDFGMVVFELDDSLAPLNVAKLIEFFKKGLFDSRIIQRIAHGFVLQFTYENYLDPDLECILPLEASATPFVRGVIGIGGDGMEISAPSDFFITLSDNHQKVLNGRFSAVGKVVSGMEIIDAITQVECQKILIPDAPGVDINRPIKDIIIDKVTVL